MIILKPKKGKRRAKKRRSFKKPESKYKNIHSTFESWDKKERGEVKRKKSKRKIVKSSARTIESIGETRLAFYLDMFNIPYEREVYLKGCVNPETGKKLFFDFYIKELNLAIEYDGKQHFVAMKVNGGYTDIKSQKKRDNIKNVYCRSKGITLHRFNSKHLDSFLPYCNRLALQLKGKKNV